MPNLKHVHPNLRSSAFVPHIYSAQVLVYNTDDVKDPPQSLGELLDPKWKGKVGVLSQGGNQWLIMAASVLETGTTTDFDKAKAFLLKLNANGLRLYPETDAFAPAFKSGEISVAVIWLARSVMWQNAGVPVKGAFPKEGRAALRLRHGHAEERTGQGRRVQIHERDAGAVGAAGICRAYGLSAHGGQRAAVRQGRRATRVARTRRRN